MNFARSALFKTYGVIYLSFIGAAIIYVILLIFYLYLHDDTNTVIFNTNGYVDDGGPCCVGNILLNR